MLLLFLYLLQENPSPTWKKEIAAAWLAQKQGDYQQAATAYKEILDTHPDLASSDPDSFFHATAGVGFNTLALGKLEQAESVYRGALALARTREHPSALQLSEGLALVLGRRGAFPGSRTTVRGGTRNTPGFRPTCRSHYPQQLCRTPDRGRPL